MNITRRDAMVVGLGTALSALGGFSSLHAQFGKVPSGIKAIKGGEELWLAMNAYIYGYPLVTMEMTRRVTTNVAQVEKTRAPMGQFLTARSYPDDAYRGATAANAEMASLHDRMPLILGREHFARWLDCRSGTAEGVLDLLEPFPDGHLVIAAVNPRLNDPRAEGDDLQEAASPRLLL